MHPPTNGQANKSNPKEIDMSKRVSMLALAAIAALATSALLPANALAFGHGNRAAAPAPVVSSHPTPSPKANWGYGGGWGYGRGWCYWHPYACYYR
jgi:hypothetical protein